MAPPQGRLMSDKTPNSAFYTTGAPFSTGVATDHRIGHFSYQNIIGKTVIH